MQRLCAHRYPKNRVRTQIFWLWPQVWHRTKKRYSASPKCQTKCLISLAPGAGFEPATIRLTVECSTAELSGNKRNRRSQAGLRITKAFAVAKDQLAGCAPA